MPTIEDCDPIQDAKAAREAANVEAATAVRQAYSAYLITAREYRKAREAVEAAKKSEDEAREKYREASERLGVAIHATRPDPDRPGKYYAIVGGTLFLVHANQCHTDMSKLSFYLEPQDVSRFG